MSQYTLLFLELMLVAGAGFFFWSTRKLLVEHSRRFSEGAQPLNMAEQADAMEMARDVAELLAELQAMAGVVRNDLTLQSTNLQETLGRAEAAAVELKLLLAKTGAEPTESREPRPAPVHGPSRFQVENQPVYPGQPPVVKKGAEAAPAKTKKPAGSRKNFGEVLADYAKFLRSDDRSEATIVRLEGHVREFLTWLAGQRYSEAPVSRIDAAEFEAFISHMETQNYRPATLKRKLAALRAFSHWLETVLDAAANPVTVTEENLAEIHTAPEAVEPEQEVAPSSQVNNVVGHSRYQAVLAMANEGLEQSTIAARTGLEQEAIRMMLRMAPSSSVKH